MVCVSGVVALDCRRRLGSSVGDGLLLWDALRTAGRSGNFALVAIFVTVVPIIE